jgi:hypothetical protein
LSDQFPGQAWSDQRYGILFGALSGLGLTLVGWGVDGISLSQANGILPWVKIGLGMLPCMVVCMVVGWVARKIDHGLVTTLLWAGVGIAFAWGAAQISFRGVPLVFKQYHPELAAWIQYPFEAGQQAQMILAMVSAGLLAGIASAFFASFVRGTAANPYAFGRLFPVLIWFTVFGLIGFMVDDMINLPLREPVNVVERGIIVAIERQENPAASPEPQNTRPSPLDPLKELLSQPRQLILMDYDEAIVVTNVIVLFGETRTRCVVMNKQLLFCKLLK